MLENKIYDLTNNGLEIGRELFKATGPLFDKDADLDLLEKQRTLIGLYISCYQTFESIIHLLSIEKVWDATVLYRSYIEGATKLIYLCSGKKEDRKLKLKEYSEVLPEIEELMLYIKAQNAYSIYKETKDKSVQPIKEMADNSERMEILQKKYPKKDRRVIQQKWSFSELTKYMKENNMMGFEHSDPLVYYYTLSSHFIHKDYSSVAIMEDRTFRDDKRREFIQLAHIGNIILDSLQLLVLVSSLLSKDLGKDKTSKVVEIYNENHSFFEEIKENYSKWIEIEYK